MKLRGCRQLPQCHALGSWAQLLQDTSHPPLLLYGQRRMGKTSLLHNLCWLLPNHIVPLLVDLQGPVALVTDHAGFLYNIAKAIYTSAQQQKLALTQLEREALINDPFTTFDDWLDRVEVAALALDEFEALDSALRKGRYRLLRRELIEQVPGGYGFQVEVIRRWFAQA